MRRIWLLVIFFISTLIINSLVLERYFVRFPEIEFVSEKIPPEFDGYKIAVISDLHYGFLDPLFWVKNVIHSVNEKNPDLIVGLGDYVKKKKSKTELSIVWKELKKLKAKDGVLLVNGNHDHWADHEYSLKLLEESGYSLRYKSKIIHRKKDKIQFVGVGDYWEDNLGLNKILSESQKDIFTVLLSHNPDFSEEGHDQKVDLFLTGHTHGGQFRIPLIDYSPVVPIKNKKLDKGMKVNKFGENVFISAGIGWSIIPIRFNCPAEVPIIILRLKK
ncbi:MAG: metallophosphoesterase [Leptospiraceae bacterium]|nr:metallophosphoesterase [Leptospiraceae bacterium]